jgi:hypothetical protein
MLRSTPNRKSFTIERNRRFRFRSTIPIPEQDHGQQNPDAVGGQIE